MRSGWCAVAHTQNEDLGRCAQKMFVNNFTLKSLYLVHCQPAENNPFSSSRIKLCTAETLETNRVSNPPPIFPDFAIGYDAILWWLYDMPINSYWTERLTGKSWCILQTHRAVTVWHYSHHQEFTARRCTSYNQYCISIFSINELIYFLFTDRI